MSPMRTKADDGDVKSDGTVQPDQTGNETPPSPEELRKIIDSVPPSPSFDDETPDEPGEPGWPALPVPSYDYEKGKAKAVVGPDGGD